jgi:outer membrane immunogenic protein
MGVAMKTYQVLKAIVVAGLVAGVGQAANAADLDLNYKPAPAFTWSACYVGLHAGAGALQDSYTGAVNPTVVNPAVGVPTANVQDQWGFGVLAGGQVGCDWQIGRIVLGIASDASGTTLKTESNFTNFNVAQKASTTNPWNFDLTARAGIAFDQVLLYTKAGVVWGSFKYNFTSFNAAQAGSAVSTGFVWGAGLEYAVLPQFSIKVESDVLLFSSSNVNIGCAGNCVPGPNAFTASISAYEIIFKIGGNYRFDWTH